MIEFDTTRFGRLSVQEDRVIHFPHGLIGLSHLKRYVILDYKDTEVKWLQSIEDPAVAFIVIEPFVLDKNYELNLPQQVADLLDAKESSDLVVLIILRVQDERVIANFQGPLVINTKNMRGIQIIVESASIVSYNNISTLERK
ncbi:MAG: hypothetical protein D6710_03275 [Nitrospirae bacterium]|nr:MAG: hypothetical protein D6710_03275 [Nitrospirota bacterium]